MTPPEGVTEGEGEGSWRPRFWCLPDGYEVLDASLEDISVALRPRFTPAHLATDAPEEATSRAGDADAPPPPAEDDA
jgi:hypothetical protein